MELLQQATAIIAKAAKRTEHKTLKQDDLVFWVCSTICHKIIAVEGEWAVISDKESEFQVLLEDLASSEAVRVTMYEEVYGDRMTVIET